MVKDSRQQEPKTMVAEAIAEFERSVEAAIEAAKRRLMSRVLTTQQVADKFGVTRQAVYKWIKNGDLKAYEGPSGYGQVFDLQEVERFMPRPRGYHRGSSADQDSPSRN